MRILPAGLRPGFVDGTVVVGTQKGARCDVQYVIAVLIKVEVLFYQLRRADAQVSGQPLDVDVAKNRTGRPAAVCTSQTVDFLKNFLVQFVELFIEILRRADFQLAEELLV